MFKQVRPVISSTAVLFLGLYSCVQTASLGRSQALPGADPNIIIVDPTNTDVSQNPIHIQLTAEISIGFPNTSGTGYIWTSRVENESIVICTKGRSIAVKKGNEPVVGFRTLDVFLITAKSIGSTRVNFLLERPSDGQLYSIAIPIIVDP
jgi:hypothetical protein